MGDDLLQKSVEKDLCFLSNFPMPPTVNKLHRAFRGRVIKSKEFRNYEQLVKVWMMTNRQELHIARAITLRAGPMKFLHLDTVFKFHRKSILTLENRPKRNDTSNRLKALHDVLGAILGIDDCWFWSGAFDKMLVEEKEPEGVEITLIVAEL